LKSKSKKTSVAAEKERSMVRAKKSGFSLASVLMKEGASTVIPAGGLIYSLSKTLFSHAKNWYSDRRDARLEEFHQGLLVGIPEEGHQEFLKNEFSMDEYYAILNHVVQDEEDSKVKIYAKIFQGLQLRVIPDEYRLHLIKCSRELKSSDFELIRQLYINEKYEFKGPGNKISQIRSLAVSADPIRAHSIQTLIRWGFLSTIDVNKPPWPTQLLKFTAEFIYDEEDLTDESTGRKAKTAESERLKVFIACDNLGDNQITGILLRIGNSLHQSDIRNVIANPIRKSLPLIISPIIAICQTSKGNPFENIKKYANLENKSLIQILLPGGNKAQLPAKDAPTFDLTADSQEELHRLVEFIKALSSQSPSGRK
jgi:hypothetical protein